MSPLVDRIDLALEQLPARWYNAIPDMPSLPEDYIDPSSGEKASKEWLERISPRSLLAQEFSLERWFSIPEPVLDAYRLWRPTPLFRAHSLERHLGTPAEIYFKYEGSSPSGSHKLNSALAQAYLAHNEGLTRLVTDTGAGQWGSALALAGRLMGIDVLVYMVRASYHQKPYRRVLMETYGATVLPSPSEGTEYGRGVLQADPEHPGSEGIAVSEALETVFAQEGSRYAMGAFANHVILHQSVIGLELKEQLAMIDRQPDYLVASVGCGSNFGGFALPWVSNKLEGMDVTLLAAEPEACATLTHGEYRYDFADSGGSAPSVKTYTLGHEFVPPAIHAGGLRYHGAAPLVGLARHEGLVDARCYSQQEVFDAGALFAQLTGLLPAPETAHAIRAAIELAEDCKASKRRATIVFCYSGHGLLDLAAYDRHLTGELDRSADEPTLVSAP
jgi:tryptophan synthase beta chain